MKAATKKTDGPLAEVKKQKPTLRFCHAPEEWVEGVPLGNGRLGAMLHNGPHKTHFSLNIDRLWRRKFRPQLPAADGFCHVRQLCSQERWRDADTTMRKKMAPEGGGINPYQPLAELVVSLCHHGGPTEYQCELDLNTAVCTISYKVGEQQFRWVAFVSSPAGILVVRIERKNGGTLPLLATELWRTVDPECKTSLGVVQDTIIFRGEFTEGIRFAAGVRMLVGGDKGKIDRPREGFPFKIKAFDPSGLVAVDADSVTLLATGFVDEETDHPAEACLKKLQTHGVDYSRMLQDHIADYRSLSQRCHIWLGGNPRPTESDDSPFHFGRSGCDAPELYERLFEMGRYLMIASSRPGTVAANLQGIWNQDLQPAWASDFHADINLEMNYWPTEVTNLTECAQPLFDTLQAMLPAARENARRVFGMKGIMIPGGGMDRSGTIHDGFWSVNWVGAAAWLAEHYWWHWEFNDDKDFLLKSAYPFLKEAAEFYLAYLCADEADRVCILPSASPENFPAGRETLLGRNSTIDILLLRELFGNLVAAEDILGIQSELGIHCHQALDKLPVLSIDAKGVLAEMEGARFKLPHRHLSHLIGLFPGNTITPEAESELAEACRKAIAERESLGVSEDWVSFTWVWLAALYARLGEGDQALRCLDVLTRAFLLDNMLVSLSDYRNSGWGQKWIDLPAKLFQIESSFGATAAISEMLIQSHRSVVRILPALPTKWAHGSFSGLVARGGFEVSVEWDKLMPRRIVVLSRKGLPCRVRICRPPSKRLVVVSLDGSHTPTVEKISEWEISFPTRAGCRYSLLGEAMGSL